METDFDAQTLLRNEFNEIKKIRDELRRFFLTPEVKKEESFTHYYLPVNIERMISTIKINKKISDRDKCKLSPITVINEVKELLAHTDSFLKLDVKDGMNLLRSHFKVSLASKEICIRHRMTPETFTELINEIKYKLKKSIAHPGEAVGAIAA